jgi:MFS family permease
MTLSILGTGYSQAIRAFLTALVPKHEMALLYTLISVFSSVGMLVGSPILGYAFALGIRKGGTAIGLPFFCAAVLYGVAGLSIWSITASEKSREDENDTEPETPTDDEV